MAGIGKRMPLTMAAFALAAAGMAGIPLVAGFVSKWYLLIGAIDTGGIIFAGALLVSGVLNIAYFWPIVYQAYFESPEGHDDKPLIEGPYGGREVLRADGGRRDEDGDIDLEDAEAAAAADPEVDVDEMLGESQGAHEGHYAGPPEGGWEKRDWRGGESTWFMLGPILAAATGAFLLGVVPHAAVFLRIVQLVVDNLPGVGV